MRKLCTALLLSVVLIATQGPLCLHAEVGDPLDPFAANHDEFDFGDDENKSAEELLFEGTFLLEDERPLDARSKLLKALQKDPKEYRAHLLLASYYMVHVGHFQLALKYVKQAQRLFTEKEGAPPYLSDSVRLQHQRILYLLSQARLSLDDYEGALRILDEFTGYGYYADWYPGSRAWILMKLGKLQEAIREARAGLYAGSEAGRTLNMLGILLSMTGDRVGSIEVFKQAIAYEFALGRLGQPATPLNNVGEVYEEIFNEVMAQSSYSRATTLPDGCEHVLPSLNLAKLYLDELNIPAATRTMNNFQSCVAQFPLRNGEEHRALVHLVRGRIALLTGHIPKALEHFREVLAERQWFGKIGTSQDDLRAAASFSLAQALRRLNDEWSVTPYQSFWERFSRMAQRTQNSSEAWWLMRRGRQILIDDLKNMEDLYIRNTDSMIEYPTFGEVLSELSTNVLESRIEAEKTLDRRTAADTYYSLYRAQNHARAGDRSEALTLLDQVITHARPQFDNAVKVQAMLTKLSLFEPGSPAYRTLAQQIFAEWRPALRNHGFQLPAAMPGLPDNIRSVVEEGPFLHDEAKDVQYALSYDMKESTHVLTLSSIPGISGATYQRFEGKGDSLELAVMKLSDSVFQIGAEEQ